MVSINPVSVHPYWVCLDSFVDLDSLLVLDEQLCHAVATSTRQIGYGGDQISQKLKGFLELPEDHPDRIACAGMDLQQLSLYLGLRFRLRAQSERILVNRKIEGAPDRLSACHHEFWEPNENTERFRFFTDWLDTQPIFESYGRIFCFLNCANQFENPHRDGDIPVEFIWIRMTEKPLFMFPDQKERIYVKGNVIWFNHSVLHSIDRSDYYSASIRVDGVFTDDVRRQIYHHR